MRTGVYRIKNQTNGKCYIGSTITSFKKRWTRHRNSLNTKTHHSVVFQRAWNKYDSDAFEFEVLLYCDPQDCLMYEQIALDYFKPEYNVDLVAGSRVGSKHSVATRTKMSQDRIGVANSNYGNGWSKAAKIRMSKIKTGSVIPSMQGENNHNAKLTSSQVLEIRKLLGEGLLQREIAERFGVSRRLIGKIKLAKAWKHI